MMYEVTTAQRYLIKKYGSAEQVPPGSHVVPIETDYGTLYMRVMIDGSMGMSGFTMYEDEACQVKWGGRQDEEKEETPATTKEENTNTICPKCEKPTFRKTSSGKTTCFECMTTYNIIARNATIPEILLQHGFVEVKGEGMYSNPKAGVEMWIGTTWCMTALEGAEIPLPNLTPDNLPTLLHILGIAKHGPHGR